jgi:nitrite reductase/ring-hydroxylating ferredoxin subunit
MLKTLSLATVDGAPAPGDTLCRLEDVPEAAEGRGKSFCFGSGPQEIRIFLVRQGDQVRAYLNACPHAMLPLDWTPDRFMDPTRTLLQCASHGAQFRIDDGFCVEGPCAGKSLTAIPIEIADGDVKVGS